MQTELASGMEELVRLCRAWEWDPPLKELQRCVLAGEALQRAVVEAERCSRRRSVLEMILCRGSSAVVRWSLESVAEPIDWTAAGGIAGGTLLHAVCGGGDASVCRPSTVSVSIVEQVVFRLETHPLDVVDWSRTDHAGRDALGAAASAQLLSALWPVLQRVPHFADQAGVVHLKRCEVWLWDWEALGAGPQSILSTKKATLLNANQWTGRLCRLCGADPAAVTTEEVLQCVKAGADVLFRDPYRCWPVLHWWVWTGAVDCVRACLTTRQPLDVFHPFNGDVPLLGDGGGYNHNIYHFHELYTNMYEMPLLHLCLSCRRGKGLDEVEMFELFLHRLDGTMPPSAIQTLGDTPDESDEKTVAKSRMPETGSDWEDAKAIITGAMAEAPRDVVDWGTRDANGWDVLSWAAECRKLSVVWPLLQRSQTWKRYRQQKQEEFPQVNGVRRTAAMLNTQLAIYSVVYQSDWQRLCVEHQAQLFLCHGVSQDTLLNALFLLFSPPGMMVLLSVAVVLAWFLFGRFTLHS